MFRTERQNDFRTEVYRENCARISVDTSGPADRLKKTEIVFKSERFGTFFGTQSKQPPENQGTTLVYSIPTSAARTGLRQPSQLGIQLARADKSARLDASSPFLEGSGRFSNTDGRFGAAQDGTAEPDAWPALGLRHRLAAGPLLVPGVVKALKPLMISWARGNPPVANARLPESSSWRQDARCWRGGGRSVSLPRAVSALRLPISPPKGNVGWVANVQVRHSLCIPNCESLRDTVGERQDERDSRGNRVLAFSKRAAGETVESNG